jgi:two-component system sensor histidine kinase BaeS
MDQNFKKGRRYFRHVKLKLPIKIFLAFLTVSIASISMVVTANYYFANRNFESYLRFKGVKTLDVFSGTLADFYQKHGGWEPLASSPEIWTELVRERWPSDETRLTGTDEFLGSEVSLATEIAVTDIPMPDNMMIEEPYGRLYPHVSLFNAEKEFIVGEERSFGDASILPVTVDGKTVGYVGLAFGEKLTHPLDLEFMRNQSKVFHVIGAVVLLISIAIAFILTKHLLAPIKRFSAAAKALGERDFNTRIPVRTNDELGALARQFNTMAQKLETYERNQKQWLSDISHELRTPLAILIGEITALQEGVRKPDQTSLSSLCDEAKHLSKIVNDLHYLSLSEAGTPPLQMDIIKPVPVLSQAIYFFKSRLEDAGMTVEVHLDPASADVRMKGDRDRLMQLFTNLLGNTLHYTDKPGRLEIRQRNTDGVLKITLDDSPPGVPPQDLPRLFERLFRADLSRSRETGGSGIGLAICKTIAENHGGQIEAHHSKLGGVKIEIQLPLLDSGHHSAKPPRQEIL